MRKFMMGIMPTYPVNQVTAELIMNPVPPTLYSIMNSIANYDSEVKTKIRNLIKKIFNPIAKFFIFKLNWFYND